MTETDLQNAIIELAELLGYRIYHVARVKRQLRTKTSIGFPDLVMAKSGRLILSELKSAHGVTTWEQKIWLSLLVETVPGIEVYEWRPKDWTDGTIDDILMPPLSI